MAEPALRPGLTNHPSLRSTRRPGALGKHLCTWSSGRPPRRPLTVCFQPSASVLNSRRYVQMGAAHLRRDFVAASAGANTHSEFLTGSSIPNHKSSSPRHPPSLAGSVPHGDCPCSLAHLCLQSPRPMDSRAPQPAWLFKDLAHLPLHPPSSKPQPCRTAPRLLQQHLPSPLPSGLCSDAISSDRPP